MNELTANVNQREPGGEEGSRCLLLVTQSDGSEKEDSGNASDSSVGEDESTSLLSNNLTGRQLRVEIDHLKLELLESQRHLLNRLHDQAKQIQGQATQIQDQAIQMKDQETKLRDQETQLKDQKAQIAKERHEKAQMLQRIMLVEQRSIKQSGPQTAQQENEERCLPEDTFSFMVISKPYSFPMIWSMLVLLLQVLIFGLVAVNIIDTSHSNPLGIPANVDSAVRFTQFVAILIAVYTQDDIRTAILLAYDGFQRDHFEPFMNNNNISASSSSIGISFGTWLCAVVFRIWEGGLGLVVTFLLVVRAETVIDLLLNFTAMEFISQWDEIAFFLAKQGFVGRKNKQQAKIVSNTVYSIQGATSNARGHIVLLLIISVAMLIGWCVVVHQQVSGLYLCQTIHVQFSDDLVPELGAFSGLYGRHQPKRSILPQHVTYVEKLSGKATFGYCKKEEAWTFSFDEGGHDPCQWLVKSPKTISYNLESTASMEWVVKKGAIEAPLQFFRMACYDCHNKPEEEVCGGRGLCDNNSCLCDGGFYGLRCEFDNKPCPALEIDITSENFAGSRQWSTAFRVATHRRNESEDVSSLLEVYNRPVYLNETSKGFFEVIMFTGRRWILTDSNLMFLEGHSAADNLDSYGQLAEYLSSFHAHFSDYQVAFVSEPMDVDTPKDSATPIGMRWYRATAAATGIQTADSNRPVNTVLLCGICDNITNPCLYDGVCINGKCQCMTGSSGVLCQATPLGNGRCDPFFNTAEFGYDNGDCCSETCASTTEHSCGKGQDGYSDFGYYFCHSDYGETWSPDSEAVGSISGGAGLSGSSVAISPSGTSLAVGDPGNNLVRVFDRDGKDWIQRGGALEGPPNAVEFGARIEMANQFANDVSPSSPLLLAVGYSLGLGGNKQQYVRLYDCVATGCQLAAPDDIVGGPAFALSGDGDTLIVDHWGVKEGIVRDRADVYYGPPKDYGSEPSDFIPLPRSLDVDKVFSSSRDGQRVAISSPVKSTQDLLVQVVERKVPNTYNWNNLGSRILVPSGYQWQRDDNKPKQNIALSGDGMILAVGCHHNQVFGIQVYIWDGDDWDKHGTLLTGDKQDDFFGYSVDLSHDGSIVVGGTNTNTGSPGIRVYFWNGTDYQQLGDSIPGGSTSGLSLTGDGYNLAVGLPEGKTGGTTSVYKFRSKCPYGSSLFRLSYTTGGDFTTEMFYWSVTNIFSGKEVLSWGPYNVYGHTTAPEYSTFTKETCLDLANECYVVNTYTTMEGSFDAPAGYSIIVNGTEVLKGPASWNQSLHRHHLGSCSRGCPKGKSLFRAEFRGLETQYAMEDLLWSLRYSKEVILSGGPYELPFAEVVEVCIPTLSDSDCGAFSITSTERCYGSPRNVTYAVFFDGQELVTSTIPKCGFQSSWHNLGACVSPKPTLLAPSPQCDTGKISFAITTITPNPSILKWSLRTCWGELVAEGEPQSAADFDMAIVEEVCVPRNGCLSLHFEKLPHRSYQFPVSCNVSLDNELVWWDKFDLATIGIVGRRLQHQREIVLRNCTCPPLKEVTSIVEFRFGLKQYPTHERPTCQFHLGNLNYFYSNLFSSTFPDSFRSFEANIMNSSTFFETKDGGPMLGLLRYPWEILFDFNATISFRERMVPNSTEVLDVLRNANYEDFVQQYVWRLSSCLAISPEASFKGGCVVSSGTLNNDTGVQFCGDEGIQGYLGSLPPSSNVTR